MPKAPSIFAALSQPNASRTSAVGIPFQHPAGLRGDEIALLFGENDGGTTFSAPDGTWTALTGSPLAGSGGAVEAAWWKRLTVADRGQTFKIGMSGTNFCSGSCSYWRGCPMSGNPQDVNASSATLVTTTVTLPSITTVTANTMLVMMQGEQGVGASHTGPGFEQIDIDSISLYWQVQASAGATGTKTITTSASSGGGGFLVALKPSDDWNMLAASVSTPFPHPPL